MTVQPVGPGRATAQNAFEEQQLAQSMGYQGVYGNVGPTDSLIFMGSDYADLTPKPNTTGINQFLARPVNMRPNEMFPIEKAKAELWNLDYQQRARLDDLFEKTYFRPSRGYPDTIGYWNDLITYSGLYSSQTGTNKSPFDIAEMMASTANPDGSGTGGGPSTTSYRDENVNLSDPSTARSVLDSTLGRYLGRSPNQKEYKSFLRALNSMEQATPSTSERVTRSSGGQNQTVSTKGTSTTGLSREQFATEYAKGDEQYAETTLSTTGLQAFLGMMR